MYCNARSAVYCVLEYFDVMEFVDGNHTENNNNNNEQSAIFPNLIIFGKASNSSLASDDIRRIWLCIGIRRLEAE